jgi:hypothetical protein
MANKNNAVHQHTVHTHTLDKHKDDDVHEQSEAEPLPITLQQNLFGQHL